MHSRVHCFSAGNFPDSEKPGQRVRGPELLHNAGPDVSHVAGDEGVHRPLLDAIPHAGLIIGRMWMSVTSAVRATLSALITMKATSSGWMSRSGR
jgi:hypothetical protein